MALFKLAYPPGIHRNGTEYQNSARYWNASLTRFSEGTLQPMGGWREVSASAVTDGHVRTMITWRTNDGDIWCGLGSYKKLFVMSQSGAMTDITPAGFTEGRHDADFSGGYGVGDYGSGTYGAPRGEVNVVNQASMWTLDTWGENLVGVMAEDGDIYEWDGDTLTDAAAVSNAPTAAALLVTDERILMALGAGGNPRNVAWSDQEDNTEWTPAADNQAGDIDLQTGGRAQCGVRVRGGVLLFTDADVHFGQYLGPPLVYGFERIATGCGAVSRGCVALAEGKAFWMGQDNFWVYNGFVSPLQCDVGDFVFSSIERSQMSKTTALHLSAFGEVWWLYQDDTAQDVNRYVLYNYRENTWNIGALDRSCGIDRGVFSYPMMTDRAGNVYEHEIGHDYDGAVPFAEGGPIEIGTGRNVMKVQRYIPDEKTQGDVTTTFYVRQYPNAPRTAFGPYSAANPVDLRFTARQVSVRYEGNENVDWRVGTNRLEAVAGGRR